MNEYTFEMVPGLVGRIAELLESIDQKLDKVNVAPIPTDDTPELMTVKGSGPVSAVASEAIDCVQLGQRQYHSPLQAGQDADVQEIGNRQVASAHSRKGQH